MRRDLRIIVGFAIAGMAAGGAVNGCTGLKAWLGGHHAEASSRTTTATRIDAGDGSPVSVLNVTATLQDFAPAGVAAGLVAWLIAALRARRARITVDRLATAIEICSADEALGGSDIKAYLKTLGQPSRSRGWRVSDPTERYLRRRLEALGYRRSD